MSEPQTTVEKAPEEAVGAPAAPPEQPAPQPAAKAPEAFQQRTPGQPAANPWAPPVPKVPQRPVHNGRFKMHFLVPVAKSGSPGMVSGGLASLKIPQQLRSFEQAIANPAPAGQAYAPACNPRIGLNEMNMGSGEPWALLCVVSNEAVIDPSACQDCMATDIWKKSIEERPHPLIREDLQPVQSGCCG